MPQNSVDKKADHFAALDFAANDSAALELGPGPMIDQPGGVFNRGDGDVNFRTVGWLQAAMIFLKIIFATGVLLIPSVMVDVGAVPGSIILLAFTVLNGYSTILTGSFQKQYPSCHSITDIARAIGGVVLQELTGALSIISYIITALSGVISIFAAANTLSNHAVCTI
ncbi:hypothetical protein PENPOL_c018G04537 [Penicillium polonicum]|uniref:Amino acid transporter transmembrane domain-containing protein n=1 Tax=Penicillium polonicum TaxID=60169 RepID=A0A1V6N9S5_PENPO|nr:hypothetical protein PENPOL_c018G04537 [Penicillium polonicum]